MLRFKFVYLLAFSFFLFSCSPRNVQHKDSVSSRETKVETQTSKKLFKKENLISRRPLIIKEKSTNINNKEFETVLTTGAFDTLGNEQIRNNEISDSHLADATYSQKIEETTVFQNGHSINYNETSESHAAKDTQNDDRPLRKLHNNEILFHWEHDEDHSVELAPDWMIAHYINVGQGDATLLEFSCGAMLIDTGGERTQEVHGGNQLVKYLDDFFKRRTDLNNTLDLVVLTHPHKDHVLGSVEDTEYKNKDTDKIIKVEGLIDRNNASKFIIKNIIDNGDDDYRNSGGSQQNKFRKFALDNGIPYQAIYNENIKYADGLTNEVIDPIECSEIDPAIRVLWGQVNSSHSWSSNDNNDSIVIRVDFGESSFLFTGDLQEPAIIEMISSYQSLPETLDIDVYQVGHHGSHNATTDELMKEMTPKIAVISMGDPEGSQERWSGYTYGHPRHDVIDLLLNVSNNRNEKAVPIGYGQRDFKIENIDKAIYATGWDGHVLIFANSIGEFIVETEY